MLEANEAWAAQVGDEGDGDGDEAAAGAFVSSSFKSRDFRFSCSCRMNTLEPALAQPGEGGCGAAAGGVFAAHPSWAAAAGGAVAAGGVVGRPSPPT